MHPEWLGERHGDSVGLGQVCARTLCCPLLEKEEGVGVSFPAGTPGAAEAAGKHPPIMSTHTPCDGFPQSGVAREAVLGVWNQE